MTVIGEGWDGVEEEIATLVIKRSVPLNIAIGMVCRNNPKKPVNLLVLATVSFVTHIEIIRPDKRIVRETISLRRHKIAVALAADVAALGVHQTSCSDLAEFWDETGDKMFSFHGERTQS